MRGSSISSDALADCKRYMRVDGTEDDAVILSLMGGAAMYLGRCGVLPGDAPDVLYNLALWALTLHWYDHRDDVGNEASVPKNVQNVIEQCKCGSPGIL